MMFGHISSRPGVLRLSTVLRRARERGESVVVDVVSKIYAANDTCEVHGRLEDPIVGTVAPDQIAICCPWCSAPEILAQWEDEGRQVLA